MFIISEISPKLFWQYIVVPYAEFTLGYGFLNGVRLRHRTLDDQCELRLDDLTCLQVRKDCET